MHEPIDTAHVRRDWAVIVGIAPQYWRSQHDIEILCDEIDRLRVRIAELEAQLEA